MQLGRDFEEFLQLLNKNEVEYLLVGAYAMGIHGVPRTTGDMDIWISVSSGNAEKMMKTIKEFVLGSPGLSKKDFLKEDQVVQLGYEPNRIDIITSIDGVEFKEAYSHKQMVQNGALRIPLLGLKELMKNKQASGRKKDLADLDLMRRVLRKKDKKGNQKK